MRTISSRVIVAAMAVVALPLATPAWGQQCQQIAPATDRCPDWLAVYDGGTGPGEFLGVDRPAAVSTSPDGSAVFVTGHSAHDETGLDIVTIAYDPATGSQGWAARHAGPGDGRDEASSLAVSPDGSRLFVAGVESATDISKVRSVVIAYDATTGAQLWTRTQPGISLPGDDAAIEVSPDSELVYVVTKQASPDDSTDLVVRALNARTGTEEWSGRQALAEEALGAALAVSTDRVFIGATEGYRSEADADYLVAAFQAGQTGGEHLWTARYDGPYERDLLRALEVATDGSAVFATGESDGAWRTDAATVAFGAQDGAQLWVSRFETIGWDAGYDLAVQGDHVYVAGTAEDHDLMVLSANMISSRDALLVAYDTATGSQEWFDLSGAPGFTDERSLAVDVAADGRVFATGWSAPALADYGPVGGGGTTFDKDGSTSHSYNTSTTSIATLAYSADGALEWSSRIAAAPDGTTVHAAGLAAAPDGSGVYVTASLGRTYGDSAFGETSNYTDYLTMGFRS